MGSAANGTAQARRALCRPAGVTGVLALVAALSACTTGKPGTTTRHYSVSGNSHAGFAQSVHAAGPRGGRAFGLVEITFHPSYKMVQSGGRCRAQDVRVELELVITLPRWQPGATVPAAIKRRWGRFEHTVRAHEMTHVRIARAHARLMRRKIAGLTASECGQLGNRIASQLAAMKAAHLRAQEQFDQREKKRIKALL